MHVRKKLRNLCRFFSLINHDCNWHRRIICHWPHSGSTWDSLIYNLHSLTSWNTLQSKAEDEEDDDAIGNKSTCNVLLFGIRRTYHVLLASFFVPCNLSSLICLLFWALRIARILLIGRWSRVTTDKIDQRTNRQSDNWIASQTDRQTDRQTDMRFLLSNASYVCIWCNGSIVVSQIVCPMASGFSITSYIVVKRFPFSFFFFTMLQISGSEWYCA
jgi:hypothetical protein